MNPRDGAAREAAASAPVDISAAVRETVFAPIGGGGLVQQTVRRLGEAIGMGLLKEGERLPSETELASRLEISPMTLRQALAILRESGYIETIRGRGGGTFVKRSTPFPLSADPSAVPTADELRDLTALRVAVSGHAAALAAERATASDLGQLARLVDQMAGEVEFQTYRQLDSQFHLGIASAARSRRLIEAEGAIQRDLSNALALGGEHPTALSLESANDQHARILAAIRTGKPERARSEMEAHVRGTADILIGLRLGMIA
jgi:DNA-binding FadR family transcriptional regulator